ncbi:hypothetical protein T07_6323 [Trichinella nelsoni]|uniref:Secreted protein n=1 Tax=Trichinella nelsoni TaxID=6336 RepID=A0A0V0RS49_9BILA|nr:hypothetical protein T07_6323 [Trichinella nelsoni]
MKQLLLLVWFGCKLVGGVTRYNNSVNVMETAGKDDVGHDLKLPLLACFLNQLVKVELRAMVDKGVEEHPSDSIAWLFYCDRFCWHLLISFAPNQNFIVSSERRDYGQKLRFHRFISLQNRKLSFKFGQKRMHNNVAEYFSVDRKAANISMQCACQHLDVERVAASSCQEISFNYCISTDNKKDNSNLSNKQQQETMEMG